MTNEMTPQQIENWRSVLLRVLGPYAVIMPEEQIYAIRDKMQNMANEVPENNEPEYCQCDPQKHGYKRTLDGVITCNKCKKVRNG